MKEIEKNWRTVETERSLTRLKEHVTIQSRARSTTEKPSSISFELHFTSSPFFPHLKPESIKYAWIIESKFFDWLFYHHFWMNFYSNFRHIFFL